MREALVSTREVRVTTDRVLEAVAEEDRLETVGPETAEHTPEEAGAHREAVAEELPFSEREGRETGALVPPLPTARRTRARAVEAETDLEVRAVEAVEA